MNLHFTKAERVELAKQVLDLLKVDGRYQQRVKTLKIRETGNSISLLESGWEVWCSVFGYGIVCRNPFVRTLLLHDRNLRHLLVDSEVRGEELVDVAQAAEIMKFTENSWKAVSYREGAPQRVKLPRGLLRWKRSEVEEFAEMKRVRRDRKLTKKEEGGQE